MTYKQGDVVTLFMSNGVEFIGKLVSENDNEVVLNKPRLAQMNQQGVGLMNGVCVTGDEPNGDIAFNKMSVVFIINTVDTIAKGYQQQVSGIVLPTGGLKV